MRPMKKIIPLTMCALLMMSLAGCKGAGETKGEGQKINSRITAENEGAGEQDSDPVAFTDDLQQKVIVNQPQRVAAVSGSLAEAWLLAGGKLTAVTDDITNERDITLSEDVVNLGLLKSPNLELIIANQVDFVLLSATIAEHVELKDMLHEAGITTAYFDVETFEDYLRMMDILTDITGRKDLYEENGTAVKESIEAQIARADGTEKTVLFLRAFSTGVRAKGSDSMTGQMLKDLGCTNIADEEESLLEDLSMEAIIAGDPDYIFVTTMGESEEAAMNMVDEMLLSNPAWSELTAVKNENYYVLPKALFHNKPNNRWGESYTILADILYGEGNE